MKNLNFCVRCKGSGVWYGLSISSNNGPYDCKDGWWDSWNAVWAALSVWISHQR